MSVSVSSSDKKVLTASGVMVFATENQPRRRSTQKMLSHEQGRANAGDKFLTLVASALAGGDCIDDADALRAGGTEQVLGCAVSGQRLPPDEPSHET